MAFRRAEALAISLTLGLLLMVGGGWVVNDAVETHRAQDKARAMTGGEPQAGRAAMSRYACGGCHEIPGVPGAAGKVGPSLKGVAGRAILAGRLSNTPDNMIGWIIDPKATDPRTAMPSMGVKPQEARDMAAYLYSRP